MIRALRFLLGFCGNTLWYGVKAILGGLAGVKHRPGGFYDQIQRGWGTGMLRATRITVQTTGPGRARLDDNRPRVYISNHASFVDIWALLQELPGSLRFVFKKEFMYIPVLGLAMRAVGHIAIDRAKRAAAFASYDQAAKAIQGGISALVFAEGTRTRTGRLQPFKKGPFVLAIAAQVPLVPIFCEHTYQLLPKGSIAPRRGEVVVHVGEPISTEGLSYEDRDRLSEQCRHAIVALGAKE